MSVYSNLIFPSNLETSSSAYILFLGQEWGTKYREDMTADYIALNNYISVALPLPSSGLTDSTSHNWESTEGALLNITKGNISKIVMKGALDKIKARFGNMVSAQQFKSGRTINDFAAMMYGGQDFREFEFEFELIPDNATDANKIIEIIDALKLGSLPKNLGFTIGYPYFWTVKAINPGGDEYFSAEKCVINNLSINKFQNNSAIHTDGQPISTSISIGFTELYKEWRKE